ncbi:MAG TPA: hypothetical protein VLA88_00395 [Candidatus Saccharimonadales bacterium]|nr:hypothetical protein [Candidatus Saccharimonadales bacterium]
MAVALSLGACDSSKSAPKRDKTFVVLHQGTEFCGYLTEATADVMCGNSGVPEQNRLSPEVSEEFDTGDGVDADDRLVAHLVCGNLITRLPANLQSDPAVEQLWLSWTDANPPATCTNYATWIANGQPNATTAHKAKKPKLTKPAPATTAPTNVRPTPKRTVVTNTRSTRRP